MKFLLDANLSPETAEFLRRRFSFDAASIVELKQSHLDDQNVIALAKRENRIIITHDLDFGLLYREADPKFGALILRLADQRIESVNAILEKFFQSANGAEMFKQHPEALVILNEISARLRK